MNSTRRGCLAFVGAGLAGQVVSTREAKAAETVAVTGEIESEIGASLDGSIVEFIAPAVNHFEKVPIEGGAFEVTLEADTTYHVTFWHQTDRGEYRADFDDVPLVYDLEQDMTVGDSDTHLGTYEVPEGHEVQVRFEDTSGNPIEGLHIGFRTSGGSGTGPQSFFTNSEGYVFHEDEDDAGVELVGDLVVEVQSPRDHTDNITPKRLSVTEDREWTVQLQDPEAWGGTVVSADSSEPESSGSVETETDPADGETTEEDATTATDRETSDTESREAVDAGDHRGFFTNDPDSSVALLDDPVVITWGGILVSIVGITMQLLGGDS